MRFGRWLLELLVAGSIITTLLCGVGVIATITGECIGKRISFEPVLLGLGVLVTGLMWKAKP
jgi:hypothetical protein